VDLRIGGRELTQLWRFLSCVAPEEGCALLLGDRRSGGTAAGVAAGSADGKPQVWRLRRIWPCLNVWEPAGERRRRFAIDPREQLLAQRWSRQRGLEVLGAAHSHPQTPPLPSVTDRALCFTPGLMLILGRSPGGSSQLGCWWLSERGSARRLMWKMED
jgi:proteasome lid subunit RPN8/RPN11